MSTHKICFCGEIIKIFICTFHLFRGPDSLQNTADNDMGIPHFSVNIYLFALNIVTP